MYIRNSALLNNCFDLITDRKMFRSTKSMKNNCIFFVYYIKRFKIRFIKWYSKFLKIYRSYNSTLVVIVVYLLYLLFTFFLIRIKTNAQYQEKYVYTHRVAKKVIFKNILAKCLFSNHHGFSNIPITFCEELY